MDTRRLLVMHHTAGASGVSSIEFMRAQGLSAHIVIERTGEIIQCRPFNLTCDHAGRPGKSRWRNPKDLRTLYDGLNSCSIGVELANAGPESVKWATEQPGFRTLSAKHRNGGIVQKWEIFQPAQLEACEAVSIAVVQRYNLDDLVGHEDVAPERKVDPGPAFPMLELRRKCGFEGLPKRWNKYGEEIK